LAAVSAFGLGGVNCHAILEEAKAPAERRVVDEPAHPAKIPARGTYADRFAVELVPLALSGSSPRLSLAGKRLLLVRDPGDAHRALAGALTARRAIVEIIAPGSVPRLENRVDGVVDLSTLRRGDELLDGAADASQLLARHAADAFSLLRAIYPRLADAAPRDTLYVVVTGMGGTLGLTVARGTLFGASLHGLVKGLKQELPHVLAKAIDFDPDEAPELIAATVIAELEDGNERMEVGYAGRRLVTNLRRASFRPDAPVLRAFDANQVFLFSGGGRGVAFEKRTRSPPTAKRSSCARAPKIER
jgi:hypothetical protein